MSSNREPKRKSPTAVTNRLVARARAFRIARRWTQSDLAERLSALDWPLTTATAISKMESGLRLVSVDEAFVLAEAFGVTVEMLLSPTGCDTCDDAPPPGFQCRTCGAEG
jgi:transcriptional regulator with XRE-family HTH domain